MNKQVEELPSYSKNEEIFNMSSHIIGGIIGLVEIGLCIALSDGGYELLSGLIFGISLIILYAMSSTYHGLNPKQVKLKNLFRVFDHCSIFILIAGSYTPFILCILREYNSSLGWAFYGGIWFIAVLGIILNAIDMKKFKVFSMICYLVMGWSIITKIDVIMKVMGNTAFYLLLGGGIAYTIGFVFYAIGKKKRWMHSVFHILCIIGSILHVICILKYVL